MHTAATITALRREDTGIAATVACGSGGVLLTLTPTASRPSTAPRPIRSNPRRSAAAVS